MLKKNGTKQQLAYIGVRAEHTTKIRDGEFIIAIPTYGLDPDEQTVLDRLFPNTQDRVMEILKIEALISRLMTPAELALAEREASKANELNTI